MSRQNLKDAVDFMAADMTSAGKKPGGGDKDPAARAELERKHGQIFIITESEYIGAILPLYGVTTGYDTWVKKPKNKAVVKTIFAEITSFMKNRTIQLMSGVGTFAGPLPVKGKTIGSKEQRKKELYQEVYQLQNFLKQWFKLKRYLPYEETKNYSPSYAWPSHLREE